ncbi:MULTISPECIES: helix-turn-helix transcriptional regulator [Streptomyces]|uniref:Transcriptional regulator n=2 Tax=Streptomyces TaxID=1883 RepID=A0A2U9PA34_STRAS|nr:transcriptional regulator [Streptomyces actuosus]AWT46566.1 transcriptional regulator [Streptomyces actuosus]MBM4823278.1 transcriptional regulator [Streptomyces actuosus]
MASDPIPPTRAADAAIDSVSVLGEDLRRRMFTFIRRAHRAVTRDEAAASVGISRKLAAFHLDKLVDAGLLRARYETPGGVRKVGRQPKVYEPTDTQLTVSIPDRRHELLADLLLDAVLTEGPDERATQAATRTAGVRGRLLGESEREQTRPGRLGAERGLTLCERMLDEHGYEPVRETPTDIRLRNCPFHPLAAKAPDLVCGMNHAFLTGYLDGLRISGVQAVLAPRPGECCVRLTPAETDPDEVAAEDR